MHRIPFNRPCLTGREFGLMRAALARRHVSSDGRFTRLCQEWLERRLGVEKALLTTSGTAALEMAALILGVGPGDEVIVPSFTFVSTASAFALRGARLVFVDSRPDTLNIDERRVEEKITRRTKAIVVVHYGGVACELAKIAALARRRKIPLVEDNAHGLLARYRGRPLGSFGALAALSFHETKNVTCGEGGALLINDARLISRAEIARDKGTDRSRFLRGEVDKYTWVGLGSSYGPSDLLAAFLYAQLTSAERVQAKRRRIWDYYYDGLSSWAAEHGVLLPVVPRGREQGYHMFHVRLPSRERRAQLLEHLDRRGIHAVFHFQPLHASPMGRRFGGREGDCPVAEAAADRLVRLPFYTDMPRAEQREVVDGIVAWSKSVR